MVCRLLYLDVLCLLDGVGALCLHVHEGGDVVLGRISLQVSLPSIHTRHGTHSNR